MQAENADTSIPDDDSDDDFDWEEVAVPLAQTSVLDQHYNLDAEEGPSSAVKPNIEITLQARPKKDDADKKRRAAQQAERVSRLNCHKAHTVILLGNAQVRNKWINDELLHARLLSLIPLNIQNSFIIHKSRVPQAAMRGRMFESAMVRLVDWWCKYFTVLSVGHVKNRTYEDVQKEVLERVERANDKKGKRRARDDDDDEDDGLGDGEVVRSEKSLMKHALQGKGCRDTSAQLFTALCRALGIPARLVVSLQSVPWQANAGKPKSSPKKKTDKKGMSKSTGDVADDDDDMEMEEVAIPTTPVANGKGKGKAFPGDGRRVDGGSASPSPDKGKGKQKAPPVITLRKSRGQKLGSASTPRPVKRERSPDPLRSAPVFWTEVFSRADARWLPVDPVRGIVNKRKLFDPSIPFNTPPHTRVENRMVYVLALEEDGFGRDVTARYAREYGAKVSKLQQGGRGKKEWWERVMAMVRRPYRLNRDDVEDEELHVNQITEQMPTTMTGFKNHPLYVLARHLKRDEVIHPLVELGKFRGEPVYPRSSVVSLKTAENWMRQGRRVREGCQPMKWVKQRAVTVNKRRAVEMALAEREERIGGTQGDGFSSEKDIMQGLYAQNQTELYVPDPIVGGKVPRNQFGNIDLYVPSMLPAGGVHVPYKGVGKIARQLGFDYAEAVTSFEFRRRQAVPVLTGIVVAAENEDALLEAYWAAEKDAEEKRKAKRQENAIRRWQRLVQGLRIRQRLKEQYTDKTPQGIEISVEIEGSPEAGGFVNEVDAIVQPYSLPRNLHEVPSSPVDAPQAQPALEPPAPMREDRDGRQGGPLRAHTAEPAQGSGTSIAIEENEAQDEPTEAAPLPAVSSGRGAPAGAPRTMRELAEDAARVQRDGSASASGGEHTASPAGGHRVAPRRGRKRARAGADSDADAGGAEDAGDGDGGAAPPPAKRPRPRASRGAAPPPPKSDRVLRTRAGKSAAKVQEEREAEEAYRRAVGDESDD